MTNPEIFNRNIETWEQEQKEPWMDLRYRLELGNLEGYIGAKKLTVLDAGGGNGVLAIALAEAGHDVTIVDFSSEMLAAAQARLGSHHYQGKVDLIQADIGDIPGLFSADTFDVVLCHNVIQYTSDAYAALRAVQAPLRTNGILSLVSVNKYAEVYKAAFREADLARAEDQLSAEATVATLFDHPMEYFTEQDLKLLFEQSGFYDIDLFGIRCICDWLPNAPKYRPEYMAQLESLEGHLAQKHPYYLLARFFQVVGRKSPEPQTF